MSTTLVQSYPKWVYFRDGRSQLVHTVEKHLSLGECFESPADVPAIETPAPVTPVTAQANVALEDLVRVAAEKQAKFHAAPIKLILQQLKMVENADELREIVDVEGNRPGGPRRSVLTALSDRIAFLQGAAMDAADVDDAPPPPSRVQ